MKTNNGVIIFSLNALKKIESFPLRLDYQWKYKKGKYLFGIPLDEEGYTLMVGKDWHLRGKYTGTILSLNAGGTIVNSYGLNYENTDWEYFLNAHLDATAEVKFLLGPLYLFLEI